MSSSEFLSFFFFFLEGSSGGFSRESSSDLLMSEMEQTGDGVRDQEEYGRRMSPLRTLLPQTHYILTKATRTTGHCNQKGQRNSLSV